jgi:hypothetical protein
MNYNDMPVIIPVLATGYLLTIYLLLILAERATKTSRYVADSFTDAYIPYAAATDSVPRTDEIDRWSFRVGGATSLGLGLAQRDLGQRDEVSSNELPPELCPTEVRGLANTSSSGAPSLSLTLTPSQPQKVQEANIIT